MGINDLFRYGLRSEPSVAKKEDARLIEQHHDQRLQHKENGMTEYE